MLHRVSWPDQHCDWPGGAEHESFLETAPGCWLDPVQNSVLGPALDSVLGPALDSVLDSASGFVLDFELDFELDLVLELVLYFERRYLPDLMLVWLWLQCPDWNLPTVSLLLLSGPRRAFFSSHS